MEIPEIGIRQINIPEVYIPEIYKPDPVLPVITNLEIDVVGCTYQHRDIKNTGNTQLLLDDPNGVFLTCGESLFPSFYPIDYRPDQLVITEDLPITNDAPPMPESDIPKVNNTEKKKEEIKVEPCPPKNAPFRTGDYRNSSRIEKLVKYEKTIGGSCDPIWAKVPFRETFIGTPEGLISTTVLGVVAGGSALLAPVIQGIAKAGIKKLGKRFSKKDKV
ncbi:hypothetical protein [Hyphomonas sp.]|uniref:hypothetical protein n=1 Tax=Hyphomonas sp. TaxID=87 RepID=UPI000C89111E|nr:hypothetical protein [Hyphomonas sp.]MAL47036.1 hypothetical protein [Hyphomonas sp.]